MKYIFQLCLEGLGPTQIAKRLSKEKVIKPTAYYAQKSGEVLPPNPYVWNQSSVVGILEHSDYTGCTENFKTSTKNFRSKKRIETPKEKRLVFEDTQESIIEQETFDAVQQIRKNRRRTTATGKLSVLSGKVFCADCGAKLHYCTTTYFEPKQDFFTCSNYRSNTGTCSAHFIRNVVLCELVLKHIKNVLSYLQQFESAFVQEVLDKANEEHKFSVQKAKKDVVVLKARFGNLDLLFKRLYEDMVAEKISEERFDTLSADYEAEQKQLKEEIAKLEELIESQSQKQYDLELFLKNVRKYTEPDELTAEMVNTLIDKIIVHAPDKSSGHRKQKVEIFYRAVGIINIADDDDLIVLDGRGEWRKNRQPA